MGLKVFVDDPAAINVVSSLLERAAKDAKMRARGPVNLCLMHPELPGEVEIDLGQEFPVSPQIKGAIKSLDGVVIVEEI